MHGSVSVDPYPGYIHGKHPEICSTGCRPAYIEETPEEQLLREAREYQTLYHTELGTPQLLQTERWKNIETSIKTTGTYDLTLEELEYGAKVV